MRTIDTVLVPLDGSEFSRIAVPAAARLAARLDAAILLLSAVGSVDEAGKRDADLGDVEVPDHRVARTVVVEHNRHVVRRAALAHTPLAAGDSVELVHFVGGG